MVAQLTINHRSLSQTWNKNINRKKKRNWSLRYGFTSKFEPAGSRHNNFFFRDKYSFLSIQKTLLSSSPVSWGCRIRRLHLCRGVNSTSPECSGYDIKPSDVEEALVVERWGMWRTPSLLTLPGPLRPGVIVLVRISSLSQISICNHFINLKPSNCVQTNKLWLVLKY